MEKETYEKPSMIVFQVKYQTMLLAGSGEDPIQREVPWWDGEGD